MVNKIDGRARLVIYISAQMFFLFLSFAVFGQEVIPELELKEYEIVGTDTRVFSISGDRISTVEFASVPVIIPDEDRSIEKSQGLIDEDKRLWRTESNDNEHGVYSRADVTSGSRTLVNVWGVGSVSDENMAVQAKIDSRGAEENTPFNGAPSARNIDAVGYLDTSIARFSLGFGVDAEDESLSGERFRSRRREASKTRISLTMHSILMKKWDIAGKVAINGGRYKDTDAALPFDDKETVLAGDVSAVSDMFKTTVELTAHTDYLKLRSDNGSLLSAGFKGLWLLWDSIGIKAGADIYAYAMPGKGREVKIYPTVNVDWALSQNIYVRAKSNQRVVSHSFSDLYAMNGLITPLALLYEDRKTDIDALIGFRLTPRLEITVGGFLLNSNKAPVFTTTDSLLFSIVPDAKIDCSGMRFTGTYDRDGAWGIDGDMTYRRFEEDVPYVPDFESRVHGYYRLHERWTLYSVLSIQGNHLVQAGPTAEEDGFATIDIGTEWELIDNLSVYCDIRNLTNQEGAWWSDRYQIPGIGMYAGVTASY